MEQNFKSTENDEKAIEKARKLVSEAEKKLTTKSFLESLFGNSSSRMERALECYEMAGNLFKLAKNWKEAGDTFLKAASLKTPNRHDIANYFISAANCFKKYDVEKAINCFLKAIEIYLDMGKFQAAGANHEKIAQIYETATTDLKQAVQHYEQAADYYKGAECDTSADKCLIKAAYYYSKEFYEYMKAIEIYEEVASSEMKSTLLKYNVKTYFFQAAICYLCLDVVSAEQAIDRYINIFPAFPDSREYKFLRQIIECIEEGSVDEFTQTVASYDKVTRLDNWFITMLLRIKNKLSEKLSLR